MSEFLPPSGSHLFSDVVSSSTSAADIDCGTADLIKSQKLALEACVDPSVWEAGQGTGDQEFIYYTRDGKAGFDAFGITSADATTFTVGDAKSFAVTAQGAGLLQRDRLRRNRRRDR